MEHIKKYNFKEGLKLEFEIVDIQQITKLKKDMLIVPHRAQFYHIMLLEKARGTHYIDFKPIELHDNMMLFIPSNAVNMFDPDGHYEGKTIIFTDNFFCKDDNDMKFLHSSMIFSDLFDVQTLLLNEDMNNLKIIFNAMEMEFLRDTDAEHFHILHNMLHILLLQSERQMKKQGGKELKPSAKLDSLLLFKEFLEVNYKNDKSVSNYADKLSLSAKQLHKITTDLLSKTPKQLIDQRIVLEAKRLLSHSSLSIKEVAYELGYDEPTNFVKYFKKHASLTPSEFREKY